MGQPINFWPSQMGRLCKLNGPVVGRGTCRHIIGAYLTHWWADTCFVRPIRILHVEISHWSRLLMGYRIQNWTRYLNSIPLRWMPRAGHPWQKHLCDARFIVIEVDTSMMIILVMSWNTSTTAQVWLSWFCYKIVMDVHAWQKMRPTVTNTYHHGSVSFCSASWFWSIDNKRGWGTNVFVRIAR